LDSPLKYVFHQTYMNTDMFVGGDCFDNYQWWLLGWLQAYSVEPNINYLYRAADIYDFVAVNAWNDNVCGGGMQWCPKNTYKNAITNELFLLSSMRLHPYALLLDRPTNFYLDWAQKEWQWFQTSGMINGDYLINDGLSSSNQAISTSHDGNLDRLRDATCVNNNGTTWTYNQGVILSGLALLYNATRNATLLDLAQKIADATIQRLTYSDGILKELCEPNCTDDQQLYKGIFVRHLAYLIPYLTDAAHIQRYVSFLKQNAESVWTSRRCELDGLYSLIWSNQATNSCETSRNTSSTSAAWDLFIAVAKTAPPSNMSSSNWTWLGLGNCVDDKNTSMPNFNKMNVTETVCRATAEQDKGAVAYDHQVTCNGIQYCRIRTLSDQHQTPSGWSYENNTARTVTRSNKFPVTSCYLKVD
jgi:predicted alpha-1,6-mannanase (GH76 family)